MIVDRHDPFFRGPAMRFESIRRRLAYTVDDAARQLAITSGHARSGSSFDQLKLKRGTAAVENEYLHHPTSLFLPALLRRHSTPREFAIQVGTPKRGRTQRIKTMYAAKNATNQSQSGISLISSLSINDW
jgi:hypothetical protein